MRKRIQAIIACVSIITCFCIPTGAAQSMFSPGDHAAIESLVLRASGSFDMTIKAYGSSMADTAFPLESGESVRIYATYSPDDANLDFGLVDSDGIFHYVGANNGIIDKTIIINERGNYTLAIRNNSGQSVHVVGFVKY